MKGRIELPLIAVLTAADQGSKALAEHYLPFHEAVPVLPFLSLFRTWNEGIAFSLLTFMGDKALIVLTICIMAFVGWLWHQAHVDRLWGRVRFTLVFGGALGNLIDRVAWGHVVDFILFHVGNWSFAVFNLADSFITIGAVLIIIDEFVEVRRGRGQESGDKG